jgi:serine kinase of HPr protein (carbohydrate metabolism regulator)
MPKLHAHFDNMLNARKALSELKEAGMSNACIDLAGVFDYEYSAEINVAGSQEAPSLSALVLTSGGNLTEIAKAPLIAAANAVSGMACVEDCRDISARLSVKLDDREYEKVSELIEKNGGRILKNFME